jgi:hypothetical protein
MCGLGPGHWCRCRVPLQDIFGHAHLGCWLLLQIVCGSMRFGAEPAAGCGVTLWSWCAGAAARGIRGCL